MSDEGEFKFPTPSPAVQLRLALVEYLREHLPFQCEIPSDQIRSIMDVDGEITQPSGVFVSAVDKGGHKGIPGRILVDVDLSATAWTHLNEDPAGSLADMLASGIQQALADGNYMPTLDGWIIRGIDSWTTGETRMQESFRQIEVSTTVYLQNSNY